MRRSISRFFEYLIYRNPLNLRWKLTAIFGVLAVGSAAIFIGMMFLFFRQKLRQDMHDNLVGAVSMAAAAYHTDLQAQLTTPEQMTSPEYIELHDGLAKLHQAGHDLTYIYTMRQLPGGEIVFVVDSDADPSLIGDPYESASPFLAQNFSAIRTPVAEEELYTDEWGTWLTAYAPLYRSDGSQDGLIAIDMDAADALSGEQLTLNIALLVLLSAIPLSLAAGYIMGTIFTRPVRPIVQAADQIAAHDLPQFAAAAQAVAFGDLTRSIQVNSSPIPLISRDELGQLGAALNQIIAGLQDSGDAFAEMRLRLSGAIGQVADNLNDLQSSADSLRATASQTETATQQIARVVDNVSQGASAQSSLAQNADWSVRIILGAIKGVETGLRELSLSMGKATSATTSILQSIHMVTDSAQAVSLQANEASLAAHQGSEIVDETIQRMQGIKKRVGLSAQQIQEMGKRSEEIGAIIETIQDIAAQTNLLALNAAIEAARAGEHGRGFAVVASEVRKLAERAASAAKEVNSLVGGIQSSVDKAVSGMAEEVREVEAGVQQANQAGSALAQIITSIDDVHIQANQAAAVAGGMNASAADLVTIIDSVTQVVTDNTAAAEQISANSGEVTSALEQMVTVNQQNISAASQASESVAKIVIDVAQVNASVQTLASMAVTLQNLVGQFQLLDPEPEEDQPQPTRFAAY